jgi:hypothetical protein
MTLKENQFYDEQILDRLAPLLGDKLTRSLCGSTYRKPLAIRKAGLIVQEIVPVAIRSSMTMTLWPGLMASACISKESLPNKIYSAYVHFKKDENSETHRSVLLLICGRNTLSRKLSPLPHRRESSPKS